LPVRAIRFRLTSAIRRTDPTVRTPRRAGPRSRPLYNRVELERFPWKFRRREASSENLPGHRGRSQTPCQGEGRGFESRLPLSNFHLLAGLMRMARRTGFTFAANHCPPRDKAGAMDAARGSIRQRGTNYEFRVSEGPIQPREGVAARRAQCGRDRSVALRELTKLQRNRRLRSLR
jgi:hypothetical protein